MVFESLVVNVLNQFLGPYIKNLDASQLKIGIWNGDALLERLEIKENAFSQFNLPIRVKGGFLDRLRLQIPWKSKFTDPVIAEVEGLYLIAGPLTGTTYDAKKETAEAREKKQNQLKKIEEAKKREKEKSKENDDGFVAKLVTQIIKNIQVTVKSIHIRYEDNVTMSGHNFAAGVTLDGLVVQSTDSQWRIGVNKEEGSMVYKIVQLKSLSVYWDTDTQLVGDLPTTEWLKYLKDRISPTDKSSTTNYILRPLTADAKATLTTKPGKDPNIPQADVSISVGEVAVHMDKLQFQGVMILAESLDRMTVNTRYRKYKPPVEMKHQYKLWWQYAIVSVLEEHVKRKTEMWSPSHIRQHWRLFQQYVEKYKEKLLTSKPSADLLAQLQQLEDQLDIGNIVVARNEAEIRASKVEKKRAETSSGWFGWFTSSVVEEEKDVIPSDSVGLESKEYPLTIGGFTGTTTDPFATHSLNGQRFSTSDNDNERIPLLLRDVGGLAKMTWSLLAACVGGLGSLP
ncbi:intermembrane lipid transfer protein VPS13A-like [Dysidea avara]|uniref:intermembrane lipid transfer protein VPS13A-like n=1 Tax=Dysidea avara TaxID=196820 RepID=UPI00332D10DD